MTPTTITPTPRRYSPSPKSISDSLTSLISLSDSLSDSKSATLSAISPAISELLRSLLLLLNSNFNSLFLPPFLPILQSLRRSLTLALRRRNPLMRLLSPHSSLPRKSHQLLFNSQADLQWLLSLYSNHPDQNLNFVGLPPVAANDPILSLVWTFCATISSPSIYAYDVSASSAPSRYASGHVKDSLFSSKYVKDGLSSSGYVSDRVEAARSLNSLALDNDRNKMIIVEQGGVGPLVNMLTNGPDLECQIAAATALFNVVGSAEAVEALIDEDAVRLMVHLLGDFGLPVGLVTIVAGIVARMASYHPVAQEEFARENAVRPLVTLLAFDVCLGEPVSLLSGNKKKSSIHSVFVQGMASSSKGSSSSCLRGYHQHSHRKDWENESVEAKLGLKVSCADALWKLSRGCLSNCRKITETKALLCLAKIIDCEKGELQHYCLMTVMEIAEAAEIDTDLRRSAFKMNSPAVKTVVEQLMRVTELGSSATLQIAAMKALGCLSRTFPAKEIKVLSPLVVQLGHWNADIAAEAAKALCKFTSPDNFLCCEHSNAIVEFSAMPVILRLLRTGDKPQIPALALVCYLALSIPGNEAMGSAKTLSTLQSVARTPLAQEPLIRDLLPRAIHQLELYQLGSHARKEL